MKDNLFKSIKEDPADIISGLKTLSFDRIVNCNWLEDWLPSELYLEWAQKGFEENNDYGLSIAITYSKKCVCRRIDSLLLYNHLYSFKNKKYPEKITILSKVGIVSPKIIQKLIIDTRNELEHLYQKPKNESAENAIELAELYINATQEEYDKGSIIIVNSSMLYEHNIKNSISEIHFKGFSTHPMLVIDIFKDEIKIVYPENQEIRYSKVKDFSESQTIELTNILRKHYKLKNRSSSGFVKKDLQILLDKSHI